MTKGEADRLNERLDRLEGKVDEVRDWMHEQRGARKVFYALMGLSATFGGLIIKAFDWIKT